MPPYVPGTMRATSTSCTNNAVCPPVNCVGSWVADGVCSGACGGGPGENWYECAPHLCMLASTVPVRFESVFAISGRFMVTVLPRDVCGCEPISGSNNATYHHLLCAPGIN